jgi:lipopolysaccharide biosynthesis glycosyltransferase
MVTQVKFSQWALAFPETDTAPHFEMISYRVNKKIFATLNLKEKRCTLHFDRENQDIFTTLGKGKIYPVPNAWGRLGWTTIELKEIKGELLQDALLIAWRITAPKKFKKLYPGWYSDSEIE